MARWHPPAARLLVGVVVKSVVAAALEVVVVGRLPLVVVAWRGVVGTGVVEAFRRMAGAACWAWGAGGCVWVVVGGSEVAVRWVVWLLVGRGLRLAWVAG